MASQATRQIKAIIADNVRDARQARGWTQSQLAIVLGVESMAVSRWERGKVAPSAANLQALANTLERDPAWFYVDRAKKNRRAA
jgi:transcriptional regulator with XRE-family HTH domain